MAFPRFNWRFNPPSFAANGSNPLFVPAYPSVGTVVYNPNQVIINHHYQVAYPSQPPCWNFDQLLYHYALTKDPRSLSELASLIQAASRQGLNPALNVYLNQIMKVGNFESRQARNLFLINCLTLLFRNVTKSQLASLLMAHNEYLFIYLLGLKSIPLLNLYLAQLHGLLNDQVIDSEQYVNIVMNRQVDILFSTDKGLRVVMAAIYLKTVTKIIKSGLIPWVLADYLRLFLDFNDLVFLGQDELELIRTTLTQLKLQYEAAMIDRTAYSEYLLMVDKQGMAALRIIIFLNDFELAEMYLQALSEVGQPSEIESMTTHLPEGGVSYLHALAFTGNMPLLNLFVNFLIKSLGAAKAGALLAKQACMEDDHGQLPYYRNSKDPEPMNHFIKLLQANEVADALSYLEDCLDLEQEEARPLFPGGQVFCSSNSIFFFSGSAKSAFAAEEKQQEELEDGEAYLPGELLKAVNSPA